MHYNINTMYISCNEEDIHCKKLMEKYEAWIYGLLSY